MNEFEQNLKNPPKKYRPVPFWSWNENLDCEETVRQVGEMDEAGIGGYFMHARGGLQTEYLSDAWFDNIGAAVKEGEKRGMAAWGYDENGWPSGFGGGIVNGMGLKYQQKYLRYEETDAPVTAEHTITNLQKDGRNLHFYYDVNPFYVDTLDGEVIEAFLQSTHEAYREKMGADFTRMAGFFTDEPQVSRNGIPWSFILEREYEKAYGSPLTPFLTALFFDVEGYRAVRYRFWKLVRDLFAENFMKKIGDWCRENGSHLTGHMVLEEGYYSHILANGCCMSPYEYMDMPGMDHLGRSLASVQAEMQVSSVANQLGKKQILSETFALSGWNVSFEDLRKIYEHQMVHGITTLCQHLEGYSLRGIRKRDYPASLFKQQPWWQEYRVFNDTVSRIGMLIAEGKIEHEILVLHTVESGWLAMNDPGAANGYCNRMIETMNALERAQLQYHLGDGRIMERYGAVEDGKIRIGTQRYGAVIVPPASCFGKKTAELLRDFKEQGGLLIFTDEEPAYLDGEPTDAFYLLRQGSPVIDHNDVDAIIPDRYRKLTVEYDADRKEKPIFSAVRRFDEQKMTMYYLCNSSDESEELTVSFAGGSVTRFDPVTGEEFQVDAETDGKMLTVRQKIHANNSLIFFVYDDNSHAGVPAKTVSGVSVSPLLKGNWEIAECDNNALTLDVCDLYFDGEKVAENLPISDVQEKACAFRRRVKTEVVFRFQVRNKAFNTCELVLETPEIFDISVNGNKVEKKILGFVHDRSFKRIDIAPFVKTGTNEIRLCCDFEQSATVYENLEKSLIFESEKNKLTYDMEIEAVYLKGDFGVYSDLPFEMLDRRACRVAGGFYLDASRTEVHDGALWDQGYPFFAGTMTFRKTVCLTAEQAATAKLTFEKLPSTVSAVKINGHDAGKVMWQPYETDLSPFAVAGENVIEITVTGNLRNMMGPFHLKEGESFGVCPHSFFHESPVWLDGINKNWDDGYCFVEYGLFL